MSASASQSKSDTSSSNVQASTQGGGAGSVTVTSGGSTNYNDPTLELATVGQLGSVVSQVLAGVGALGSHALDLAGQSVGALQISNAGQTAGYANILQSALNAQASGVATGAGAAGNASLNGAYNQPPLVISAPANTAPPSFPTGLLLAVVAGLAALWFIFTRNK